MICISFYIYHIIVEIFLQFLHLENLYHPFLTNASIEGRRRKLNQLMGLYDELEKKFIKNGMPPKNKN